MIRSFEAAQAQMPERIATLQGVAAQTKLGSRRKAALEFLASQESWRVQRDADCALEEALRDVSPNWQEAYRHSCLTMHTRARIRRIDEHLVCIADEYDCYR